MYFTALTAFQFPIEFCARFEEVDEALAQDALKPIGPQELVTYGFVSPFGEGSEVLHHRIGNRILVALGTEERVLPPKAVDRALRTRLQEIEQREGRVVGARERRRLKDEVVFEMIPRAFTKFSRLQAYIDLDTATLYVDTASRKAAENVVSAIRRAYGTFPALPLNIASAPRQILTGWVSGEPTPARFAVGDEAELRDGVERGAVIKAQRQELHADEIHRHIEAGKQCVRIGLCHDDRLTFVVDDTLAIRKLKVTDLAVEALDQRETESAAQELDARFALMSGLISNLAKDLFAAFEVQPAGSAPHTLKKAA
jgi:recombination associated protein RdgC